MKISSIDIGTNTLLMVVAEQNSTNQSPTVIHDIHAIARLGEGVDQTAYISEAAFERASEIVAKYRILCESERVQHIRAVATSAVRDAANGAEVCQRLGSILGTAIECISGEEEARLSFIGASDTYKLKTVIDIGGGSTEYVTGENNIISHRMSVQMGAVRLHERYLRSLPPTPKSIANAREEVRRQLDLLPQAETMKSGSFSAGEIIGVGGTFTTLAAIDLKLKEFDSALVHQHILSAERVSDITKYLLTTPLPLLLENPAIHPKRADILPAGAVILDETLRFFGASVCTASTKGLRYGVLYDTFANLHRRG